MSFLKTIIIIFIMIAIVITSGCTDATTSTAISTMESIAKEQATPTIPVITDTPAPIVIVTDPTPVPTPTSRVTLVDVMLIENNSEIPWCKINYECINGTRSMDSQICIDAQFIPEPAMRQYCGLAAFINMSVNTTA